MRRTELFKCNYYKNSHGVQLLKQAIIIIRESKLKLTTKIQKTNHEIGEIQVCMAVKEKKNMHSENKPRAKWIFLSLQEPQ